MNLRFLGLLLVMALSASAQPSVKSFSSRVNPFIGTRVDKPNSLSGSTFPGATLPFGFVQLSPDTSEAPGNPASGYNYSDQEIYGFSHTHLSGTGCADLFDVLVMPWVGESAKPKSNYRSRFSHEKELARPGYYRVSLLDWEIEAELTATEHAGFHRYTFPQGGHSHVFVDLAHTANPGNAGHHVAAQIRVVDNRTLEGYRFTTGWVEGFRKVYFRAEFSKPFVTHTLISGEEPFQNLSILNGKDLKAVLDFETIKAEPILIKVGLSSVSAEGARLNLSTDIPGWSFDEVARQAGELWDKELGKIEVEGTPEQLEIFYTALYHAFIQPNNIADVNGDYVGTDMTVRRAPDRKHYSTFSLWDTYRAANPLYTLTQPEREVGFINSMLRQYDTYGFLPIWQLWGLENFCTIGNHAIPPVVDAALKRMKGFDYEKAFEAVKASSTIDHLYASFTTLEKYGYLPEDIVRNESVSTSLEIAYNDWCVAQLAKRLAKTAEYERFMKRASFYTNLFDAETTFFRGKNSAGAWHSPFDPLSYGGDVNNNNHPYTEANAWQYSFYVPQDVNALIALMGGKDAFVRKLDTLFTLQDMPKWVNMNASGFIGQYAHGNEPSQHSAYLYDFAGQPWKTQRYVARILQELYTTKPSGIEGNDDCGQMSAWYVLSAMGFYPVNPANGIYVIGSPALKSAAIHLADGKRFLVTATNVSKANVFIQSAKLNGKVYERTYVTHDDITSGGALEFVMGDQPNTNWGAAPESAPLETPPDHGQPLELNTRGGLPNFFRKASKGESLNVAYFGGSITEADGWRVFSFDWLKERFPRAHFTEINAAIGGTGSDFGVFRLHDQVLAHSPDLVFVEFAVNDQESSDEKILANMEGIVRQIWEANRNTDICFIYTLNDSSLKSYQDRKMPPAPAAMEQLAAYYGIPSITFGWEVVDRLKNKTLVYQGPSRESNGIPVFCGDGTHPYSETGHKVYFDVLKRSFEKMQSETNVIARAMPQPLSANNFSKARMADLRPEHLSKNWAIIDTKTDPAIGGLSGRMPQVAVTSTNGETITIRFTGKAIGVTDILGPDCCRAIVATIDGKVKDTVERFDPWSTWHRISYFVIDQLEDTPHEVVFKAITEPFDKAAILKRNNERMNDPKRYVSNFWRVGKLLIDGKLEE